MVKEENSLFFYFCHHFSTSLFLMASYHSGILLLSNKIYVRGTYILAFLFLFKEEPTFSKKMSLVFCLHFITILAHKYYIRI